MAFCPRCSCAVLIELNTLCCILPHF
uniref:Uncharacterized protein n=1 Tax=Anguilla anguilla TaxID=7936 RepID=A0A0E9U684_ANGAN